MAGKRILLFAVAWCCFAQGQYDLLLQGGHVIDAKNHISAVRDVAIRDGKITAAVEAPDRSGAGVQGGQLTRVVCVARAGGYSRPRLRGDG